VLRELQSALGVVTVVLLGLVFCLWFGPTQSTLPVSSADSPATVPAPPGPDAHGAIGGGPRSELGHDEHGGDFGPTLSAARRALGDSGPMDCYAADGAPYVGTDC
jgi:hypothetical protein